MPDSISIDLDAFNNEALIDERVAAVDVSARGALRTALNYLYKADGPINLPRDRLLTAEPHLGLAEKIVIRWLYTRTNGSLRKTYGADALRAARSSRYRCGVCGFSDVRVLNIDHVDGRVEGTAFACLCANCHTIKSRESDWSGEKQRPAEAAVESTMCAHDIGDESNLKSITKQLCPVCHSDVENNARYPKYVCQACASKASSSDGRLLIFSNAGLSGGLTARFADTGESYVGSQCYIDGFPCRADEAYFGGIVIEALDPKVRCAPINSASAIK